jgi:hypothetical protein
MISSAINQVGQAIFGTEAAPSAPRSSLAIEMGGQEGAGEGTGAPRVEETEAKEIGSGGR